MRPSASRALAPSHPLSSVHSQRARGLSRFVIAATVALGGCTSQDTGAVSVSVSAAPTPAVERVLDVDLGSVAEIRDGVPLEDGSGRVYGARLRVRGDAAALRRVDGPRGEHALQFPGGCRDEPDCPRAIIEVLDASEFSPGNGDFRLSVRLKMDAGETSAGANVAQKGFSTGGGGQWKLQVDGEDGIPSCVVVETSSSGDDERTQDGERHVVFAGTSVSDGVWHDVTCTRRGSVLGVDVDGAWVSERQLPDVVDIRPDGPVRIGGKNLRQDNDQFSGAIQEVVLEVEGSGDT